MAVDLEDMNGWGRGDLIRQIEYYESLIERLEGHLKEISKHYNNPGMVSHIIGQSGILGKFGDNAIGQGEKPPKQDAPAAGREGE